MHALDHAAGSESSATSDRPERTIGKQSRSAQAGLVSDAAAPAELASGVEATPAISEDREADEDHGGDTASGEDPGDGDPNGVANPAVHRDPDPAADGVELPGLRAALDHHVGLPSRPSQIAPDATADAVTQNAAAPELDIATTEAVAAQGATGADQPVPHLDKLQQAFGPEHDLTRFRAKVGDAAQSADKLGGLHFAFGSQLVFGYSPSVGEAAHEVTHALLQDLGRAPTSATRQDRSAEEHAETVAARVEAGQAVGELMPASRVGHGVRAVQRKAAPGQAFLGGEWALINEPGVLQDPDGARLRTAPNDKASYVTLPQNTKVQILKHDAKARWYAVVTSTGTLGYVADWLVYRHLPEPGADIYLIKQGDTPLEIARVRYGKDFHRWGQDLRFVVNALVYVNNRGPHNGRGDAGLAKAGSVSESWLKAKAVQNAYIWLPSKDYLNSAYEEVRKHGGGTGSASFDAFAAAATKVGGFGVLPSFVGGLADGFLRCIADTVVGLFDLVKSIFTGQIIEQLKALWGVLTKLSVEDVGKAVGSWAQSWLPRLTSENSFVSGHAWGHLVGYACGEIAMFALGGPALNALKASKLATKFGQVIAKVAPNITGAVGRVTRAGAATAEAVTEAKNAVLRRFGKVGGTRKFTPVGEGEAAGGARVARHPGFHVRDVPAGSYVPISGHGAIELGKSFRVPAKTRVIFLGPPGSQITDALGQLADVGGNLSKVPTLVFESGTLVPELRISRGTGLAIKGTPIQVTNREGVLLSELIQQHGLAGKDIVISACTHSTKGPWKGVITGAP
jgi:hypothetical protein